MYSDLLIFVSSYSTPMSLVPPSLLTFYEGNYYSTAVIYFSSACPHPLRIQLPVHSFPPRYMIFPPTPLNPIPPPPLYLLSLQAQLPLCTWVQPRYRNITI
jgi:hypothetical protein